MVWRGKTAGRKKLSYRGKKKKGEDCSKGVTSQYPCLGVYEIYFSGSREARIRLFFAQGSDPNLVLNLTLGNRNRNRNRNHHLKFHAKLQMLAAAGDNHTRLADLAPPFVVRHVYSTG